VIDCKDGSNNSLEPKRFDSVDMEYLDYQNHLNKPIEYESNMNQTPIIN